MLLLLGISTALINPHATSDFPLRFVGIGLTITTWRSIVKSMPKAINTNTPPSRNPTILYPVKTVNGRKTRPMESARPLNSTPDIFSAHQ